jgi:hypothetical protein
MLPQKVKILGHEYEIQLKNNYTIESGGNTGQCNNYSHIITVGAELPESSQTEILLHEILEVIDYRLQLGLEHPKICVLGEVLHQVLKDNRLFVTS